MVRKPLIKAKPRNHYHWRNDLLLWVLLLTIAVLLLKGWHDMHSTFSTPSGNIEVNLDPHLLPYYTLRTTMRLLLGLVFSLLFTFIFGVLAAKYKAAERVILPFVNFMESVPLVGFLTFTTVMFIALFPHNIMGLECAAIFGVFTGQAWNMMLIFYQTIRIVPNELNEASRMFHHGPWTRFWRIECPYSMPGLLWNTMVSQSAAWFAILATEAIPVKTNTVELPGVGSFMAEALTQANVSAVVWSVIALIANIILLDQLMFRPLVRWVHKFKYEDTASKNQNTSWFYSLIRHSYSSIYMTRGLIAFAHFWVYGLPRLCYKFKLNYLVKVSPGGSAKVAKLWYVAIILICGYYGVLLWQFLPKADLLKMPLLMSYTAIRVFAAMALSVIIFVPLGVWIGLNQKLVKMFQPIIQVLAALPANLFYPLIAIILISYHQSLSVWSIFLIMLGTQWYILFNVIAGVSTLPHNLIEVSRMFHVKGFMWWRKFMIPAVFPYIVTGIISAAGGAWNAAIASELITWGKMTKQAVGLGAYISDTTANNELAQAALGCTVMCFMVALCIVFVWKPLYTIAETKFRIN
jgi:NitT/TauT family transport system permease protein